MAETITLEKFYSSSLGQYALRWEQNQYDKLVSDCFGYNAVQLGATGIDFLKNNRIGLKVAAEPTLRPLTQLLETDDRTPLQMLFEAMLLYPALLTFLRLSYPNKSAKNNEQYP